MNKIWKIVFLIPLISCSTSSLQIPSAASRAEELRSKQKYEDAINVYQDHIRSRLKDKSRPEFENPYFYYLLVSDTYLEMGEPQKAEEAINLAQKNLVTNEFLVDRYRQIIEFYESNQQLEKAHNLATKYRELNPDTLDVDIDRLNKKIVLKEVKKQ